jgi:hypothetical protein
MIIESKVTNQNLPTLSFGVAFEVDVEDFEGGFFFSDLGAGFVGVVTLL